MYVCSVSVFFLFSNFLFKKVGGPDRPVLEKTTERGDGGTSEEGVAGTTANAASSLAASAAAVQSSIYGRLSSAMGERG